jgi:hypothetical protein
MKKYIVTAYYVDVYQLDDNPADGEGFFIKWGTLYKQCTESGELLEFDPVMESDHKYPVNVEVEYDDAVVDDEDVDDDE